MSNDGDDDDEPPKLHPMSTIRSCTTTTTNSNNEFHRSLSFHDEPDPEEPEMSPYTRQQKTLEGRGSPTKFGKSVAYAMGIIDEIEV